MSPEIFLKIRNGCYQNVVLVIHKASMQITLTVRYSKYARLREEQLRLFENVITVFFFYPEAPPFPIVYGRFKLKILQPFIDRY